MRVKMRQLCVVIISGWMMFWAATAGAHSLRIPVVIDTDMALDDIRAIAMLVNSELVDIRLCVTSDGAVAPKTGAMNATRLFSYLGRENIPVATGRVLSGPVPPWREWNEKLAWPPSKAISQKKILPGAKTIVSTLANEDDALVYLCLGPMTNLADALAVNPTLAERIAKVIFYGTPPGAAVPGWNTKRDPAAVRAVFSSGLSITALQLPDRSVPAMDAALLTDMTRADRPAARLMEALHEADPMVRRMKKGHFRIWDETVAVYLSRPSLFQMAPVGTDSRIFVPVGVDTGAFRGTYIKLFGHPADHHLSPRHAVVFKAFPQDPGLFRPDVSGHVEALIARHGYEEWKACLLTNELHRHLGIYSLVGAKMGVRAREILGAPFDALTVRSLAGNGPPLSCMNDGLQAATGASLGRGTISVAQTGEPYAAAEFVHGGKMLVLRLKSTVTDEIRRDIRKALDRFGGLCPEYFAHVRQLAIDYWARLDRSEIFDEVPGERTSSQPNF